MKDVQVFWHVLIRDPYLFLGLVSVFTPTAAYWRIYRLVRATGFKGTTGFTLLAFSPALWLGAYAREYARKRGTYGWPIRPLYVPWVGYGLGIPLVVLGIVKL